MGRLPVTGQPFTREQVATWVKASCDRQGVPVVVTDPSLVADVVVLLTGRVARASAVVACRAPRCAPAGHDRQTGSTRAGSTLRAPGVPGRITTRSKTVEMIAC